MQLSSLRKEIKKKKKTEIVDKKNTNRGKFEGQEVCAAGSS
jgi:hypothetical protein